MTHKISTAWRRLAEQASVETDSKKLAAIVTELNRVLGENDEHFPKLQRGVADS